MFKWSCGSLYLRDRHPINDEITHVVVQGIRPPFQEYVVPADQVKNTTESRIDLKCTREDLYQMEPFEYEEYVETELPGYMVWSDVPPIPGMTTELVNVFIPVKRRNIAPDEILLGRNAAVEATDGYVGQVEELLIDTNNRQATHVVIRLRDVFRSGEINIPVAEIDHIEEGTIYLKLDRQSVEELATTFTQH